ncbi:hypothetical protein ABEF95_002716 [Exophiala dermatitidis]
MPLLASKGGSVCSRAVWTNISSTLYKYGSGFNTGIIISSIGGDTAIEDIITLTDFRDSTDFVSALSISQAQAQNNAPNTRHVDFYFELPAYVTAADGISRPIPLSTKVSGTTTTSAYPTGGGGLNGHQQQQHIHGDCEVSYWIEAQFRLAGSEVGFLCKHVRISSSSSPYPRLRASLALAIGTPPSSLSPSPFLPLRAKPHLLARCCRFLLQKSPTLNVTLFEPQPPDKAAIIEHEHNKHDSPKRRVTIPLALTMDNTTTVGIKTRLDYRQSFKCSVVAKWLVHTRFSTISLAGISRDRAVSTSIVHKTSTASSQKCNILFRPLPAYPGEADQRGRGCSYAATSQIDLTVPDAVSQPSLRWTHLIRSYTLQLSMDFHGVHGVPRYRVDTTEIPVTVISEMSSTDVMNDDDGGGTSQCGWNSAQKGEGEGGVLVNNLAAVDVEESSVCDTTTICFAASAVAAGGGGAGGEEEVTSQKRRLTGARTPPPTYFR